jgi:hypothetical protein
MLIRRRRRSHGFSASNLNAPSKRKDWDRASGSLPIVNYGFAIAPPPELVSPLHE